MKNRAIEYPHPVLNEFTNDFIDCNFSIEIPSHSDTGDTIDLEVKYNLNCPGIDKLLHDGIAQIIVRVICYRTSFRIVKKLDLDSTTVISIPKKQITDVLELQSSIVVCQDFSEYYLEEFNKDYFGSMPQKIRKGDIIANEPGIKIQLNTLLEKNTSGIVQVTGSTLISEMKVSFATVNETKPELTNYIVITLPDLEYKNYAKLMKKKHLKNGIDRFLQASIILPAITEGISRLRMQEQTESDEDDPIYKGTVWADSIYDALGRIGVEDLGTCTQSDYELANKVLGNVVSDSTNNLMQKMIDWSTIRQEDEVL
ncbi:MAG: hypothetical protein MJ066_02425 [Clostridia bacterium]|nr:hypothetical protein [Clostridia bacterium]